MFQEVQGWSFLETTIEARLKIQGNILRVQHIVAKQRSMPAATLAVFLTYYHFFMFCWKHGQNRKI